jgi:hypothetical protein
MGFEGKWIQLEGIMLSEVIQDQIHKRCMFSLIWEDRAKDKHIYKNKHIQTQMFVTVELLYGTRGKWERKRE